TCDLHTHSTFSDGTLTPAALVKLAEQTGLSAVALTDHNTVNGLRAFLDAGAESSVLTVPGCEFSTDYGRTELHSVGLFLPERAWPEIRQYVGQLLTNKLRSNEQLIDNLRAAGYDITYEEADAAAPDAATFNRAHVAGVLVQKGYVKDRHAAFARILHEDGGLYVPPRRPDALETVAFIKENGGAAVLAHPFLNLDADALTAFLPEAKQRGLDAIETQYSEFDAATSAQAAALAERFGLKQSGGSDFHGSVKPDIALGTGKGSLCVPFAFYEALRDCAG
ncbi:MAG: PHP domain-containing protein, partial [Oscillospiraceae bacterium]|nr:PHP domain-containing protein [Oscillospiraceae bacterium]